MILVAIEAGAIVPLVSVAAVIEYEAVLKRAENLSATGLAPSEVDRFLDSFIARASHVGVRFRLRPSVRDANDEIFAELAILGRADALVSFNTRDYRAADPGGPAFSVPVCRPGDILRRLSWRP